MQLDIPFYEGPEDALRAGVQALGGAKKVGPMLWPDKSVDNAGRLLLDCLNPSRAEKLDFSQTLLVFKLAKDAGFHAPFAWFANEVGYDVKPITKAEEVDRLTTVVEQASNTLANAIKSLERIQNGTALTRAA